MSRQSSAWMPIYIGDYLGDTQRLTTEQHGAYLLLIFDYWRNGPAPDDDAVLQQITRLDKAAWKRHRPTLARLFQVEGGEWRHRRIDRELADAEANAERRSSKAKAAAEARWGNATGNARSMPQALPVECPPPSPSPEEEGSDTSVSGGTAASDAPQSAPPEPADPLKVMFDSGIAMFAAEGKSEKVARPLLGKWRATYGPEAVICALGMAKREGALDLTSFMERCLKNGRLRQQQGVSGLQRPDPLRDALAAAYAEEERERAASDQADYPGTLPSLPAH